MTLNSSLPFKFHVSPTLALISHRAWLWSVRDKNTGPSNGPLVHVGTWLCKVCPRFVCCGLAISRVKRDCAPFTVGMWHWPSVCAASLFLPVHIRADAGVVVSANWWLAPVCVCVCVYASSGLKVFWVGIDSAGHSPIPSSRARIMQFPRMLQLISTPLDTDTQMALAARYNL